MFGPGGNGDPFGNPFEHVHRHMRQMDNMMNAMIGDAFDMLNSFGMGMPRHPMLANNHHGHGGHPQNGDSGPVTRHHRPSPFDPNMMMMNPFGGFGFGAPLLGGMMGQIQNIHQRAMNDPDSVMVSESTMISYDGNGQPKIVQSSTRKAGDVKETRKAVRDGEREEMSVGHSIGDRSHIVEKKRDKDGRIRQQQKFINLKEDEAQDFNERFKSRASQNMNGLFGGSSGGHRHRAIENGRTGRVRGGPSTSSSSGYYSGESSAPIITIPDDDDEEDASVRRSKYGRNGRASRHEDPDIVYSNRGTGPTIQEIDDNNDADPANPKRRKGGGMFGKFMG